MTEPEPIPVSIGRMPGEPFGVLPSYDENDQRERICEPMSEPKEPDVEEIDVPELDEPEQPEEGVVDPADTPAADRGDGDG